MRKIVTRALLTGLLEVIWLTGGFTILSWVITGVSHVILRTLTGTLGLVILFTGIYYAMRNERRRRGTAGFSYLQALGTGVSITVIVAVMVSASAAVYVYLNPHFADDMAKEVETTLRQSGTSEAAITQKVAAVKNEFSLKQQVIEGLTAQTAMGTVFSLIAAAFLKSKSKPK